MEAEDQRSENDQLVRFLENLIDKSEETFMRLDPKKKLLKRDVELVEIEKICFDFAGELQELEDHAKSGIKKIDSGNIPLNDNGTPEIGEQGKVDARE